MSTKIYDAYKYKRDATTLMQYLLDYRKKWIAHQIDRLTEIVENAFRHDPENEELFVNKELNPHKLMDAIEKDSEKKMKSWGEIFDVAASVSVYFHKKKIYVQTFLNDNNAPKFVNKDMVDYHYQNQSDPWYAYEIDAGRMDKSEESKWARDYKQRKKVWDDIYTDGVWSPAQAGMSYSFAEGFSDYYKISTEVYKNWCRKHKPNAGILKEKE